MLPLMEREFVEKRKWLTSQEMIDIIAVMQSLPGLIAVNMAVLVGYRVKGVGGACAAAFGSVISPFLVILILASGLSRLGDSATLQHIFLGIRAGTAALILLSLIRLAQRVLTSPLAWTLGVFGFVAAVILNVDVVWVIVCGFVVGLALILHEARRASK